MSADNLPRLGVVIPTTGERPLFLQRCVDSIHHAGSAHVSIVCPQNMVKPLSKICTEVDQWVIEASSGAAAAINQGISALPDYVTFVSWLGDDDLLEPDSIDSILSEFSDNTAFVFGKCRYIDDSERTLFINKSGAFATKLFRFGPNLAPQPGSIIRRSHWNTIGGLDSTLKWTFDLDIFLRLLTVGKGRYSNRVVSSFRWHEGSLTAGQRRGSVKEASDVRRAHMRKPLKLLSLIWEPFIRFCIYHAGSLVTRRADRTLRED